MTHRSLHIAAWKAAVWWTDRGQEREVESGSWKRYEETLDWTDTGSTHTKKENKGKRKWNIGVDQRKLGGRSFSTSFIHVSLQCRCQTWECAFYLALSFFFWFPLCPYIPRIPQGDAAPCLTLELKSSPPPPPPFLICSLHYSFITLLCSLCSASMSCFSLSPCFRLTCQIFFLSG